MSVPGEFVASVQEMLQRLEAAGTLHMLTGGIAVSFYGTPRFSFDADVVVAVQGEQLVRLEEGLFLEDSGTDAFGQQTRVYEVALRPAPVEVFLASHPFVLRSLERRRREIVPPLPGKAWIIGPEDLLVAKAFFMRSASRSQRKQAQDAADIASIIEAQRAVLDRGLLRREAEALGVLDALPLAI